MAIYGKSFVYNDKSSDDFDLFLCTLSPTTDVPMGLDREILKGEVTMNRPVANHYGSRYSDVLVFDVTVAKRTGMPFNRTDIREINAWLTSPKVPTLFHVIECDDFVDEYVDYYGCFTATTNVYTTGLTMLTFTFTCNAPYGWSKKYEFEYTCEGITDFICFNSSDELQEYVYPEMLITANADEKITIQNNTDIEDFIFTFPHNGVPLHIDTKNHKIYQIIGTSEVLVSLASLGWSAETLEGVADGTQAIYWFRLLPGENNIRVSGDCTINMSFRVPRKVGAY